MTARPLTILPFAILFTLTLTVDARAQYVNPFTANHDGFWLEWITHTDSAIADVALADADGDGDPDLFVVDGSTLELWRNDGSGRFAPDPAPLCAIPLRRILTVEIDGDDRVDVIGAPVQGGLVFLKGLGFGAFGNPEIVSSNSEYSVLAAIDLDGDGALEIACGGAPNAGLEIVPGPRSIASPGKWFAGLTVSTLVVADPNHDQRQDLVARTMSENYEAAVVVLLNLPGFPAHVIPGRYSYEGDPQILPFDFNGDGFQDLVVSSRWGVEFDVLLGDGSGTLWQPRQIEQESWGESAGTLAVHEQPGQDPRLLTSWRSGSATFLGVFDSRADPNMANPAVFSYAHSYRSTPPSRIFSTDVDGDGLHDVVLVTFATAYSSGAPGRIGAMPGRANSLSGIRVASVDVPAHRLDAIRVHASQPPQLVLSTYEGGFFMASLREDGTLAPARRIGDGRVAHAIDLNDDAMDDLIVKLSDGTSEIRLTHPDGPGPVAARLDGVVMATGDLDEDRKLELVLRRRDNTLCVVSSHDGEFGHISATPIFVSDDFETQALVTIGDPDGDGRRELIEGRFHRVSSNWDPVLDTVATYRWTGRTLEVVERSLIWNVNPGPYDRAREIHSANMDGERGDEIVVLVGFDRASLRILKPTFHGFHWLIGDVRIGSENPQGLTLADFDGDGDTDASCVSNSDGSEGLFRIGWNDGSGTLNAEWGRPFGNSHARYMTGQDFNGDGITDLAILGANLWGEGPPAYVGFLYGRRGESSSKRLRRVDRMALPTGSGAAPAIHAITPNPARGSFAIRWSATKREPAEIAIHDLAGRRVRSLVVNGGGSKSETRFESLDDLPAGLYWVRVRQGNAVATRRVALIR